MKNKILTFAFTVVCFFLGWQMSQACPRAKTGAEPKNLHAGKGVLRGKVQDSKTGEEILFAPVELRNGKMRRVLATDEDGNFRFSGLDTGTYVLTIHVRATAPSKFGKSGLRRTGQRC